jgi:hypothetical protein
MKFGPPLHQRKVPSFQVAFQYFDRIDADVRFSPPARTWKWGGLWSFQYIWMTIPWKRLISGTPTQGRDMADLSPGR